MNSAKVVSIVLILSSLLSACGPVPTTVPEVAPVPDVNATIQAAVVATDVNATVQAAAAATLAARPTIIPKAMTTPLVVTTLPIVPIATSLPNVNATASAAIAATTAAHPTPTAVAKPGDTGRIVFDSPVNGKWQVFVINPDGSGLKQVTSIPGGIGDPAISPDGRSIVTNDGVKKIYVMNADGTDVRTIYEGATEAGWPAWSFDSKKIVFASRIGGYKQLFEMNADGTGLTRLTNSHAEDLAPAYSPDGTRVAFSSNRLGTWEIYALTLANGQVDQLTNLGDVAGQGWPSWSPDGRAIAFESLGKANERDIFTMNADGTGVKNLTNSSAYDGAPVWSPDGQYIAFASNQAGTLDIFIMRNDGSQVRRLTNIWAWGPSWSGLTVQTHSDNSGIASIVGKWKGTTTASGEGGTLAQEKVFEVKRTCQTGNPCLIVYGAVDPRFSAIPLDPTKTQNDVYCFALKGTASGQEYTEYSACPE